MKDTTIVYNSYVEKFSKLSNAQFGELMRAALIYSASGELPVIEDALVELSFDILKVDIDFNNEKYQKECEKRREAGRKGGLAKASNAKQNQVKLASASNAKERLANLATFSDNDTEYDNDINKKSVSKDTLEKDLSETSSDECVQTSDLAAEQKQKAEDLRVDQIVSEFNTVCKELPKVKKISPQRRKKVKTRLKSFKVQEIYQAFSIASYSSFLNGHNDSGWKATFDWFFENDSNITKVLEGNYNNKASPANKGSFNNFEQRKYDMKELEQKMLSG